MEKIDRSLDFHALRVLVLVKKEGSLSAAADVLGINQSTVSYTIGRLREAFGDELFVRAGRGVVATERCEEIVAGAEQILRDVERLRQPPEFDPATTRERVVISCNFYERTVLLPELLRSLRHLAPGLRVSIVNAHTQGHRQVLDNQCDLLVSPVLADPAGLYTRVLFEEHYVCFVDRGSRHAREGISLQDYASADHVMVNYDGGWHPFYLDRLKSLNIDIVPRLELPSFGMVHQLIEGTDLILTAPAALATAMSSTCVPVAAPFDSRFSVHLFWSARHHATPMNRWLREQVVLAARSLSSRDAVAAALPAGGAGQGGPA